MKHLKRICCLVIAAILLTSLPLYASSIIGAVLSTDIKAYINGAEIPAYNINGNMVIVGSDLRNYGFNVVYNNDTRTSSVSYTGNGTWNPISVSSKTTQAIGTKVMDVYDSDITVLVNGNTVTCYNVDGKMAFKFSELKVFGDYYYDNTARTSNLTVGEKTSTSVTPAPTQNQSTKTDVQTESKDTVTFKESVVVDNSECSIKITGIDPDNFWGYSLNVQLENKSKDKTYMYSVESAYINGVMCDPFFATKVAAGKKANDEISFTNAKELISNGIGDFTDIELTFRVYDSDDWMADEVAYPTVHIYPYGKENATQYVRNTKNSDTVIVDNEYATVIVTGYEIDKIFGYTVNLFLVNKTDKNVMFSVDDASVNGFMADPFYAKSVGANKCAFSSMSWSDSTLEKNGITSVKTIEFKISADDADDWFDDDFFNETVTLHP